MTKTAIGHANPRSVQGLNTQQLCAAAIQGLEPMFDTGRQVFCFRLKHTPSGLLPEGISLRYTMMTLIGLQRAKDAGFETPFDLRAILDGLVKAPEITGNIADFGLLLWSCALVSPDRCAELCSPRILHVTFERCQAVREGRTMELAWLLSGLAHVLLAGACSEAQNLVGLARATFEMLARNQGRWGFFGHLATRKGLAGRLRGRIGSFADQVYPIYAFSKFSQACHRSEALESAAQCADAICRVQGTLGQWWWHYDSVTGRVVERYPVYAVHQEGMAPMALFALEDAGASTHRTAIGKGLAWIYGNNERSCDLRDSSGLVWRSLYYTSWRKAYADRINGLLGFGQQARNSRDLGILRECRPYELGWLLYALAGRTVASACD